MKNKQQFIKEEDNNTVKNPKEKIISGLEGMKPGAVMQAVAKSLGTNSPKFLSKHLLDIFINAAKNGKVKVDALKGAIKDFDAKNVEDNSNIDWDHVEIDPAGILMKCFFDGDSKKIIDEFMKQYESDMKDVKKEIDKADNELHDDVKKAGVKIDDKKLDQNGLTVASVIDDDKNKGKSGKELTKEVDQKIEQKEKAKELIKTAKENEKKMDQIKIDPKIEKMSDEELAKAVEEADKKAGNNNSKNKTDDELIKEIDEKLTVKLGKDYKQSLITGVYSKEELNKNAKKFKLEKVDFSKIKSDKVVGIRIDFFGDESKDVVNEVVDDKAGYVVRKVDSSEKDEGVKKIFETFSKVLKNEVGENADGDVIAYLKHWQGKNNDGNFDSLFVFIGLKSSKEANESMNESILNEESNSDIGKAAFDAIVAYKKEHGIADVVSALKPSDRIAISKLPAVSKWLKTGNIAAKNMKNNALSRIIMKSGQIASGDDANSKWYKALLHQNVEKKIEAAATKAVEKAKETTDSTKEIAANAQSSVESAMKQAGAPAKEIKKVASTVVMQSAVPDDDELDSIIGTPEENEKLLASDNSPFGKALKKAISDSDKIKNMSVDKIQDLVPSAEDGVVKISTSGMATDAICDKIGGEFGIKGTDLAKAIGKKEDLINFIGQYKEDPDKALKMFTKMSKNKDAAAEIAAKLFPDAKDKLKDLGINVNGTIDKIADKAVDKVASSANGIANTLKNASELKALGKTLNTKEAVANQVLTYIAQAKEQGLKPSQISNGVEKIIDASKYHESPGLKAQLKNMVWAKTNDALEKAAKTAGASSEAIKQFKNGDLADGILDKATNAKETAKTVAKTATAGITNDDVAKAVANNAIGKNGEVFSYSTMSKQLSDLDDIFDDKKITPEEFSKLQNFGLRLDSLNEWAEQNKDSSNPVIQQKIELIKRLQNKYENMLLTRHTGGIVINNGEPNAKTLERLGSSEQNSKVAMTAESDKDAQKASSGWKKALGLDKAFTAIGIARLAAKSTGIVLNHGKAIIDMAGAQAMKYKEDKNIIADFRVTLTNGEGSKSKFDDTKFAIRFDVNDCKWHATCLDNRKMKFPEDKLIKIALDSEEGKKFKQYCLNRWKSIFAPEDERRAIIPYILKNGEKLGLDSKKLPKEFIDNIKKMSEKFDKIETALK